MVQRTGGAMGGRIWKVIVSLGICGLAGYLTFITIGENLEFYFTVDEIQSQLHESPSNLKGVVRMHGYVVPDSILRRRATMEYRFIVQNDPPRSESTSPTRVLVTYTGLVPDTFKSEAEVVVRGTIHPDTTGASDLALWTFQGESITAKCPSKYEAQAGGSYETLTDDRVLNPAVSLPALIQSGLPTHTLN
jgi:cytochrome c-type biogenesis protein CcmE